MVLWLLEALAIIAIISALAWFIILILSDADVSLILKAKFGKQPESLAGKVVWVTGASSGIGEAIAYCLAESGCKLVLTARRKEQLEKVKQTCLASALCKVKDNDILILPLDLTDFESHAQKVQEVLEYFNKVDILINNAGKSQRALWMDVELSVDRLIYEVNALGPVSLTQALLPHMIERKEGQIAVVSSLAGKVGVAGMRSYNAAKHALQGYFDSLRTEVSVNNIDVTIVCPGPVFTQALFNAATAKMGKEVGKHMDVSERRMTAKRCAYLTCVSVANRQYESWVSPHPPLLLIYIVLMFPDLSKWFMKKLGAKAIMAFREGK
ncbi:dehydrogenase/reductase sdr family member [Plakobranchus ocellatus]|uniref:Dehydrogenase/reductase sdr family member n=1 Tax=Plakobranchus ocellatus TaxID=259542 RepID=A0AAV3ZF07_9GAST|nr:dehydrogenase/reductase sdr family member [Plakobranchus ocellatus]